MKFHKALEIIKLIFLLILYFAVSFFPVITFVIFLIGVCNFIPCEFDESINGFYYYNNHSITVSELIMINTFLIGIILTFDIHFYDQVEPKYPDRSIVKENQDEIIENTNKYSIIRLFFKQNYNLIIIVNILSITIINVTPILQYYLVAINPKWCSVEEELMALFFTNWIYVVFSIARQFNKWLKNNRERRSKDLL